MVRIRVGSRLSAADANSFLTSRLEHEAQLIQVHGPVPGRMSGGRDTEGTRRGIQPSEGCVQSAAVWYGLNPYFSNIASP